MEPHAAVVGLDEDAIGTERMQMRIDVERAAEPLVKEIERLSGYRFLRAVSEAAQRAIKSRTDSRPTSGH